eukprot:Partr_v1_DN25858_c3_g1_i2_m2772 putative DnaJ (Hsp40) homolog, subfamily A, member
MIPHAAGRRFFVSLFLRHLGVSYLLHKFKSIAYAYSILSDSDARASYDRQINLQSSPGGHQVHFLDGLLSRLFKSSSTTSPYSNHHSPPPSPPSSPTSHSRRQSFIRLPVVELSMQDLYFGCRPVVEVSRMVPCDHCLASSVSNPTLRTRCSECRGSGSLREPGWAVCFKCHGTGVVPVPLADTCRHCSGRQAVFLKSCVEVVIPRGFCAADGSIVSVGVVGDSSDDFMQIRVKLLPHSFFRFGPVPGDLICVVRVPLWQALCGSRTSINCLSGKTVTVGTLSGDVIKPGSVRVVAGLGMPTSVDGEDGRLFIRYLVDFPERLHGMSDDCSLRASLGCPQGHANSEFILAIPCNIPHIERLFDEDGIYDEPEQ